MVHLWFDLESQAGDNGKLHNLWGSEILTNLSNWCIKWHGKSGKSINISFGPDHRLF